MGVKKNLKETIKKCSVVDGGVAMKMVKKVAISTILSVLVVVFFMPPAVTFAFNDGLKSVYTVDGKRYIDINGETYQYLSLSDFTPVEDEELIALL